MNKVNPGLIFNVWLFYDIFLPNSLDSVLIISLFGCRCGSQIEERSAKLEGTRLMKQIQEQTTQKTAHVDGFQILYRKRWDLVPQEYFFRLINKTIKLFVARNVSNDNT